MKNFINKNESNLTRRLICAVTVDVIHNKLHSISAIHKMKSYGTYRTKNYKKAENENI